MTWEAAYITDMTVVEDGKYLITAEKHGGHSVLYKRSLLGGFKLPFMKPVKLPHLGGRMSSDDYPDWHS
ncbi:MAG: hypothetical protein EXS63_07150 [Candidatus Omnitrophica bacterium]|nr:hypothetical protein [Candidatus Omnitrophota bacterium]